MKTETLEYSHYVSCGKYVFNHKSGSKVYISSHLVDKFHSNIKQGDKLKINIKKV